MKNPENKSQVTEMMEKHLDSMDDLAEYFLRQHLVFNSTKLGESDEELDTTIR